MAHRAACRGGRATPFSDKLMQGRARRIQTLKLTARRARSAPKGITPRSWPVAVIARQASRPAVREERAA